MKKVTDNKNQFMTAAKRQTDTQDIQYLRVAKDFWIKILKDDFNEEVKI
jgi:hypothetical protein